MTFLEIKAWKGYLLVEETFLGNHSAPNNEEIVKNMLTNFKILRANMSIKLDYPHYLDKHSDNLGNYKEKQRERAFPLRSKGDERKVTRFYFMFS